MEDISENIDKYVVDEEEYSPDGEHEQDIVITVVEILVHHNREEEDSVEDNHEGGDGAVSTNPGPGHTPPGGGAG